MRDSQTLMTDNLADHLSSVFQSHLTKIAVTDDNSKLTYAEFAEASEITSSRLLKSGAVEGMPIVVRVANRAIDLVAYHAIWRVGGVVVPLHHNTPESAMIEIASSVRAQLIINGQDIAHSGFHHLQRSILRDASFIVLTSGSTGAPKGVVLSHQAFIGKLSAIQSLLNFDVSTRSLVPLQITFSFGIWVSLLTLLSGGQLTLVPKFSPEKVWKNLSEMMISDVAVVPTMLRQILSLDTEITLPSLSHPGRLITGGEPLGPILGNKIQKLLPNAQIVDAYGLTETCTTDFISATNPGEMAEGIIGYPTAGVQYQIITPSGEVAEKETVGELQIKSTFIMSGYLDAPSLTDSAFQDEYFRTGDLARCRADGRVELVGRAKEIISRGGNKISPLEIDHILCKHPDVASALSVGVPDLVLGESVHVLIIPVRGTNLNESDLRKWAEKHIEKFKRPDQYYLRTQIPLGRTGKADRNLLRELILKDALEG